MTEYKKVSKWNIKISMICKTQFYSVLPQLTNDNACGFVTDFAEGVDTSERNYEYKTLKNHLLQCFRNN